MMLCELILTNFTVNGTGKESVVKGRADKWTYALDTEVGFFYATEGYIK